MNNNRGLFQAWLLDGAGGGKPLTGWDAVNAHRDGPGLLWVDLDFSMDASRQWLSTIPGLPELALDKLTTRETRPNTLHFPDGLLAIMRGVNLNAGAEVEDMISIRVWIDAHRIITCRQRELKSVKVLADAIALGAGPKTAGEFLTVLAGELAARIRQVVLDMEDTLSDFEDRHHEMDAVAESVYSDLRRKSAALRRHLNPQRDALQRLQAYHGDLVGPGERDDLQIHTDAIIHSIEDLEVLREQTQALQDELISLIARDQGERTYVLTIVAAIFLPLTFISGLLGMNVGGIPWAGSALGFWGIVGICMGIVVLMLIYFRRKRWL